jgi:hypothetical protein
MNLVPGDDFVTGMLCLMAAIIFIGLLITTSGGNDG